MKVREFNNWMLSVKTWQRQTKPNQKPKEEEKDCKLTHFTSAQNIFISFNKLVDAWNLIYTDFSLR